MADTLEVRTRKQAVFDRLTAMITELELPPGSRLVEADLAAVLNVSKTPIREALLLLEAENLVETRAYQGATVTWLSLGDYRDQHFLLDALEEHALPEVLEQISGRELAAAGRLLNRLGRARAAQDSLLFGQLTTEMHELLFGVVLSSRLPRLLRGLVAGSGRRNARVFQHQFADAWDLELDILTRRFEGIRDHDAGAAATAMRTGHAKLEALAAERLSHPAITPYLEPAVSTEADQVPVISLQPRRKRGLRR
jgi:DNA-binding GntR family transcriptional regulator